MIVLAADEIGHDVIKPAASRGLSVRAERGSLGERIVALSPAPSRRVEWTVRVVPLLRSRRVW